MKKRLLAALLSAVLLTTGTLPAFAEQDIDLTEPDAIVAVEPDTDAVEQEPADESETAAETPQPTDDTDTADVQTIDVDETDVTMQTDVEYFVNPLYADVIDESDLLEPQEVSDSTRRKTRAIVPGIDDYTDDEDIIKGLIRDAMRDHTTTLVLKAITPEFDSEHWFDQVQQWVSLAMEETSSPIEGDYIRWNYAAFSSRLSYHLDSTTGYCMGTYTITFTYYTTPEQEAELSEAVDTLIDGFGFTDSTSAYTKIHTIYDYVCHNVTYDNANLNDDDYKLKYTAYAALMNGTAVCQGYAALIYRMAKQEGIPSRIIASTTHGWNIVKLGTLYYYVDATWDSSSPDAWRYFLCGEQNTTFFANSAHTRSNGSNVSGTAITLDYTSQEFYTAYPMSDADYIASTDDITPLFRWTQESEEDYTCTAVLGTETSPCTVTVTQSQPPTCTEDGRIVYTAAATFNDTTYTHTKTKTIAATGHTYGDPTFVWSEDLSSCTAAFTCTTCGEEHTENGDVTSKITTAATCTEEGVKTYTAAVTLQGKPYTDTKTAPIPATGHTYETVIEKATPTANGSIVEKCGDCGDIKSTTAISAPKTLTLSATSYTYNGAVQKPTVTVKDASGAVVASSNYTVSYSSGSKNVGTYTVTVAFTGDTYSGSLSATYKITAKSISSLTATLSATSYTYSGAANQPTVTVKNGTATLTSGTDYTVAYSNNTNVGTATATITGKGNYTGTLSKTFTINKKSISGLTATLSATSYTYSGTAKKPTVTVKNGSATLKSGTDYTVAYSSNTNAGTAKVTITGKGNYTGTLTKTFTIKKKAVSGLTATLSKTSYIYSGNARKPTVTVKNGSTKLKSGTSYTFKYTNNKSVGKATVTITGKGNYTGTKKLTFKINPKATTLKSVTASSKGFTAKWTKLTTQTTGYQIQYATNSKFTSGVKTVTITKNKTTSQKVTKLKAKKKYYVRIRTYKTVSGTKYVSAWSKAKTVTTKK